MQLVFAIYLVVFDPISSQPLKGYSTSTGAHIFSRLPSREVKAIFFRVTNLDYAHVTHD